MRVGFVLRSAEIKPLFFDLFSYQIIMKVYEMCVSTHVLYLFGIEHLRRAIVSCSTSPPPNSTHQRVCYRKHALGCRHRSAVFVVLWSVCPLSSTFEWKRATRGQSVTWLARPTSHLVLGSSIYHTTPHKSYPGLSLGFDSRLVDEFGHTR